jgi:Swi5-dependent recombination DNA repair protein 1
MDTLAKRRRLNVSVNKPFKSPLRTPFKSNVNPPSASPLSTASVKLAHESPACQDDSKSTSLPRTSLSTPLKRLVPTSIKPLPETSESQALNKANRALESAIIRQKQDLDTIKQALGILTTNKSTELELLADKWRSASRLAAEEVFAGARDKVNKMGGVGAWRERENERKNFAQQWDQEPAKKGGDSDDGDEEEEDEDEDEDEELEEGQERPIKLTAKERRQLEKEAMLAREESWDYDENSMEAKKAKEEEALMRDDDVSSRTPANYMC